MSDITIDCIYCKKTIKLSYKSRHENQKHVYKLEQKAT